MTNPELTPPGTAIYAIKARDAVIFSPHPRTKAHDRRGRPHHARRDGARGRSGRRLPMRRAAIDPAVPAVDGGVRPDVGDRWGRRWSRPPTAPASRPSGSAGVTRRWSSTRPPTSSRRRATRGQSKTSDYGSGCSADGNLLIDDRIYDAMLDQLQAEGGYLARPTRKRCSNERCGTATAPDPGNRRPTGGQAGCGRRLHVPDDRTFVIVEQD